MTEKTKKEKKVTVLPPAKIESSPDEIKEVTKIVTEILESKEVQDPFGKISRAQVDLIKRTIADGASDDELRLFIQVCRGAKLNPFMRQAHFVPFWDSKLGIEKRAVIIGIDGFRTIAENSEVYAGNDDAIFSDDTTVSVDVWEGKGKDRKVVKTEPLKVPGKATITVYKIVMGVRCPFTATARWTEYYPGSKKGARWHAMPYLMLGKCAEALALRKAFPSKLSGIYAQEEMDQAMMAPMDDKKRNDMAFMMIKGALNKLQPHEIDSYKKKISESDKYSEAQKKDLLDTLEKRIEEIKKVDAESEKEKK